MCCYKGVCIHIILNLFCLWLLHRYRPTLPVWFVTQELEFDSTEDCVAFLTGLEVVLDPAYQVVDCKQTVPKLL